MENHAKNGSSFKTKNFVFAIFMVGLLLNQTSGLRAQGVSINGTGVVAPDPSSMLDVSSTDKGMLIPRMTEAQRNAISNPAIGLMIFNLTTGCFNVWSGSVWRQSCFECPFPLPTVSNNGPVCEGSTVTLTATDLPGAVFNWTGPNGFSSTQQSPSLINPNLALGGQYMLTVTMNGCTSNPISTFVSIKALPSTPVISSNSPVCVGSSINLSTTAITGAVYSWSGPNGFSSTTQNPVINNATTANAGSYSLIVTLNGCSSNAGTAGVIVNPVPSSPSASSNSPVCTGSTLSLAASLITGATYSWNGPNGFSAGSQNPSISNITTAASGTYSVTASVSGCASNPSTTAVTVNSVTSGSQAFTGTGSDQSFIVPACITSITIKVWGAGGGGYGTDYGGGGGFTKATVTVTPGETIIVRVGLGGYGICNGQCSGQSCGITYPGGGGTYEGNGGGGYSGIFRGTTPILIAGGGGGGGGGSNASPAGAGGGLTGGASPDATYGGKGGTQSAGGAGGSTTVLPAPGSGSYLTGASSNLGGAGGGGYYGGGGGGRAGSWLHRGGGGGSSYINPTGTSASQTTAGSGQTPANTSDPDYVANTGIGGTAGAGGNGYIKISW